MAVGGGVAGQPKVSTSVDFEAAKSVLLRRYKAQSMAWQVVETAAKLNPFAAKPTNMFFTDTVVPREQRRQGTWWVAGFHPVWYNTRVGAVIKQVLQRWSTEWGAATMAPTDRRGMEEHYPFNGGRRHKILVHGWMAGAEEAQQ